MSARTTKRMRTMRKMTMFRFMFKSRQGRAVVVCSDCRWDEAEINGRELKRG